MQKSKRTERKSSANRPGSAAVEFALVTPIFVGLVMGAIQAGYNFDCTTKMYSALRQAGRLASLNKSDTKLQPGQTLNNKIIEDVKNDLTAVGLPGNQMTVSITDPTGASPFDLSKPENDLQYFKISVTVPYSTVNTNNFLPSSTSSLSASIVFRKGRSSLVQ